MSDPAAMQFMCCSVSRMLHATATFCASERILMSFCKKENCLNRLPPAKVTETQLGAFERAKAFTHFENCWKHCLHPECKKRRRCTGGPRGTCRKNGGVPFCRLEGNCETPVSSHTLLPEPEVPWQEEPPKTVA